MLSLAVPLAVGVADMYVVHAMGAQKQIDQGWAVHFQSAHSWIGAAVLLVASMQWLSGVLVFAMPTSTTAMRVRWRPSHAFLGAVSLFGTLLSIITGILSMAYRGDNASGKDLLFKLCALLTGALMVAVAWVLSVTKPDLAKVASK